MMQTTEQQYAEIVSQVGQYIFDHCDEVITLDELAAYTGFSKYHFNRIFSSATGYQLGDYIQRRKLEKALYLIKHGHHNIIDVALSVGYESPSSFTRAFKKIFAVTPTDVMQGKFPTNERGGALAPKKYVIDKQLHPTWVELPERKIYGLSGQGFDQQSFNQLASTLFGRLTSMAEPLAYETLEPIGVSIDNPWVGEQTESQFFAGFANGLDKCRDELQVFKWRAGCWACFTHHGPHDVMWQTISQIYAQWVLPNRIKLKDQQIVQRYLTSPRTVAPEQQITELYFAVAQTMVSIKQN